MEKGDILIAVSFLVDSIKDIHNIPVKKSNFKVEKITKKRVYLQAEDGDKEFDCPINELNMFHPTGDDSFTGLFTDEQKLKDGFSQLYKDQLSMKFNTMWEEAVKKYHESKE